MILLKLQTQFWQLITVKRCSGNTLLVFVALITGFVLLAVGFGLYQKVFFLLNRHFGSS